MAENGDATEDFTMYKIVLAGNTSVGKTAFLRRYSGVDFQPDLTATVGVDFFSKTIERGDKEIKLQIWDTAGQERYRSITRAYFHGASGFVLMFDLTNEESFKNVNAWATMIEENTGGEKPLIVLVGNKSDLKESRAVTPEQCRELAQSVGMEYFEASAKDYINVKETFDYLIEALEGPEQPPPELPPPPKEPKSKSPSSTPEPKNNYCYC